MKHIKKIEVFTVAVSMVMSYLIWYLLSVGNVSGFNPCATISVGHFVFYETSQPRWWSDILVPPLYYSLYIWLRHMHQDAEKLESVVIIGLILCFPFAFDVFIGWGWLVYFVFAGVFLPWMLALTDKHFSAKDLVWFGAAVVVNPIITINGFYSGLCVAVLLFTSAFFVKNFSCIKDFFSPFEASYPLD